MRTQFYLHFLRQRKLTILLFAEVAFIAINFTFQIQRCMLVVIYDNLDCFYFIVRVSNGYLNA